MSAVRLVDAALLDAVTGEARALPRRRKNRNLHASESEPSHRLLNAVEPESYIPPHRHLDPNKDETFVVLRGRFGLVIFDEAGGIAGTYTLEAAGACVAADIQHGTYHTLLALAPGSVFLEAKGGPYAPLVDAERAAWAPAEGSPETSAYLARLRRLFS